MGYSKIKGWELCRQLNLITIKEYYIMDGELKELPFRFRGNSIPLFLRGDTIGMDRFKLPHGIDLISYTVNDINLFYKKLTKISPHSILLFAEHPSIMMVGHYIPKELADGGISIDIIFGNKIILEYVGKGFDVGEITRNKGIHSCLIIPWSYLYEPVNKIFNLISRSKFRYDISDEQYARMRENRINELNNRATRDMKKYLERCIPQKCSGISFSLFQKIYYECIHKIIPNRRINQYGEIVLVGNIYENKICFFELVTKDNLCK